jgi:hypothetical protein
MTAVRAPDQRRSPRRILPLLMSIIFISHFNRIGMSVAGATHLIPDLGI